MPCDYKEYPPNWFTFYRPYCLRRAGEILDAAENALQEARCEWCDAENHTDSIVLTIAHLRHDHTNPMPSLTTLAALCQSCHNTYDAETRRANRLTKLCRDSRQIVFRF